MAKTLQEILSGVAIEPIEVAAAKLKPLAFVNLETAEQREAVRKWCVTMEDANWAVCHMSRAADMVFVDDPYTDKDLTPAQQEAVRKWRREQSVATTHMDPVPNCVVDVPTGGE